MDNKQRRAAERMRREASKLGQAAYPTNVCLECGHPAARSFSASDVPELLDVIANKISPEAFAVIARRRLGSEGCLFAPKSGWSVCDRKERRT